MSYYLFKETGADWSGSGKKVVSVTINRFFVIMLILPLIFLSSSVKAEKTCSPTRSDAEGPFYKASVPLRSKTGSGLVIEGTVRSTGSCEAVSGARVEWWQTNPKGTYDDEHRGALLTNSSGRYILETDFPPPYSGRPSHVHFKIIAPGHRTLTTQLYPERKESVLSFDFVLNSR